MKIGNGISQKEIVVNVTSYILGIVTVAVICCGGDEYVWHATEHSHTNATTSTDEGEEPLILSKVSFVFYEDIGEITGVHAVADIYGFDENPLYDYRIHKKEEMLVVEVETLKGYTTHFDFRFVNRDEEVVATFKAEAEIDQSLITYHDMHFGDREKVLNHLQPYEVEMANESIDVPLGRGMQIWSDGRFHIVRRLVSNQDGIQVQSFDCDLHDFLSPTESVGIISDGTEGEIVHIEVLP